MRISKEFLLSSAVAALAVATAQPALAQASPEQAESGAATGLDEIVVTAQKRSESAQHIPVTVQALSGEALANSGSKDLLQAVRMVPGVIFSRAPDDGLALTFRGLGTITRSQAFDLSQALFTDGVFMGKARLYTTSFFDVDRMEFIKGTQSTMLGKNASLGAISVITKQPTDTLSFEARGGIEIEDGGYTLDGAANVPLSDKVAVRVAAHYNDLDGWVRNVANNHDGPEQRDLGLRATIRAQTTDTLTLTAAYQFAKNEQLGASYSTISPTLPAVYGSGKLGGYVNQASANSPTGDTYHKTQSHLASLKAELEVGDHTVIAQSAYIRYKLGYFDDFDYSADTVADFIRHEKYHQFSQELRVQSPAGNDLEYMAGAYYLTTDWTSIEDQVWAIPGFPPAPDPASGKLFNGSYRNTFKQDTKNLSFFASGTYRFTDQLRIAGGVRWTHESKDAVFGRNTVGPLTIWNTIANPPFDPTKLGISSNFFDGNVSLQYDIARDIMVFASFGHGSKSGGFAETNTIAVPPPLLVGGKVPAALVAAGAGIKNEYAKTYEVGFKSTLFDRRLRFNVTGFLTKVKGFQDTVFTGGPLGFITFNGPAETKGFEVETSFQVTDALRLDGSFTYSDATQVLQPIDATGTPTVDASGNPVLGTYRRSQAPKVIYNVGATFEQPVTDALNMRLNANVRHRSSMFNQRQELFPSKGITTLDLSAGISASDDRWGLSVIAKNVTHEISEEFASPTIDPRPAAFHGAYMASPTQTRTIMISAHVKY